MVSTATCRYPPHSYCSPVLSRTSLMPHSDVAVIGAGIVGLAHAWMAARRGRSVTVFERNHAAISASVRNFGMIWPVGQPTGERVDTALRSRNFWLQLGDAGVLDVEQCGSIHLAHHRDERGVLEEFCGLQQLDVHMLTAGEITSRHALANPDGLLGGMWSGTELRVNPRVASRNIAAWLAEQHKVKFHFETQIVGVDGNSVESSDGRSWSADHIVICSGSDLQTLFPAEFAQSGLRPCQLQMLRSVPQPNPVAGLAHLASGLTLRHYESFRACPTLTTLKQRIADETPELDRYGIHVMTSSFPDGRIILGDSHEYGNDITPFSSEVIDTLMLRELKKVFRLPTWDLEERWSGVYTKHTELPIFEQQLSDSVHLFVGPGGAGMTMSFGLADQAWTRWEN